MFGKSFVFFKEELTWEEASDFCQGKSIVINYLASDKQEVHNASNNNSSANCTNMFVAGVERGQ